MPTRPHAHTCAYIIDKEAAHSREMRILIPSESSRAHRGRSGHLSTFDLGCPCEAAIFADPLCVSFPPANIPKHYVMLIVGKFSHVTLAGEKKIID